MTQPPTPGQQPTPQPTAPTLTVVIPAYNEETTIGRALDALLAEGDQIDEIIVVDNNCTDDTVAVAQAHEAAGRLRIITEEQPGLIPARNAGIAAAKTPIVARIDADTIVQPGWLSRSANSSRPPTRSSGPHSARSSSTTCHSRVSSDSWCAWHQTRRRTPAFRKLAAYTERTWRCARPHGKQSFPHCTRAEASGKTPTSRSHSMMRESRSQCCPA